MGYIQRWWVVVLSSQQSFFFNVLLLVISLLFIVVHWYLDYCINNQNIQVDYLNVIQVFSFTCLFLSIHVLYSPSQLNLCQWYALGGFVSIHFSTIFSLFTVHLTITCWTFFSVSIPCWEILNFRRLT